MSFLKNENFLKKSPQFLLIKPNQIRMELGENGEKTQKKKLGKTR